MKMNVNTLFGLKDTLNDLMTENDRPKKMPFKVAYRLRKFLQDVIREDQAVDSRRLAILREHCVEEGRAYKFPPEGSKDSQDFLAEWIPFLNEELEIEWSWEPLSVDDLESVTISIQQLDLLIAAGVLKEEEPDALH